MKLNSLLTVCLIPRLILADPSMDALSEYENFHATFVTAKQKNSEAFIWYTDIPHPFFNVIMHLCCENVEEKVDSILREKPRDNPISFWIHPQNRAPGLVEILEERGFEPLLTCPLFTWDVEPKRIGSADVRRADMTVFNEILAKAYQLDEAVQKSWGRLIDNLNCENYLIYENGIPVGTATLVVRGSTGGIFNDATLSGRREATRALTEFLMQRASELKLTKLVLLSSPEGEELYSDLGFGKVFDIEIYHRSE